MIRYLKKVINLVSSKILQIEIKNLAERGRNWPIEKGIGQKRKEIRLGNKLEMSPYSFVKTFVAA